MNNKYKIKKRMIIPLATSLSAFVHSLNNIEFTTDGKPNEYNPINDKIKDIYSPGNYENYSFLENSSAGIFDQFEKNPIQKRIEKMIGNGLGIKKEIMPTYIDASFKHTHSEKDLQNHLALMELKTGKITETTYNLYKSQQFLEHFNQNPPKTIYDEGYSYEKALKAMVKKIKSENRE